MSERLPTNSSPFSGMTAIIMIAIGTLAFIAIFALMAWSPELASKNRAGPHPYSKSSLGYAGLIKLLEADGQTVQVSRLESSLTFSEGLLVITVPQYGFDRSSDDYDLNYVSEPALYVLPKWSGFPDWEKRSWEKDTDLMPRQSVSSIARTFDSDLDVWRLRNPGTLVTPFGTFSPDFEHEMQVIESDSLESVIDQPGGTILAKLPGRDIYVLSDPDFLNTFGLTRRENARMALALIDWLQASAEYNYGFDRDLAITFDATLHGFARSEGLLRSIFDIPFLGASLIALATILLIAWAAFIRFGPPMPEVRVLAFGKKALAESSAGLVSMARREDQMAEPYLQMTERNLARQFGLPANTAPDSFAQTADRIAEQKHLARTWTEQRSSFDAPVLGRNDLRDKALALWRWRQEMKDGH
ncbi:MAG: DUF4350 domain-containing protein [Pseudomonadota bacterium]